VTLGSFWLDGGYGAWGSPVPAGDGQFTSARLVAADGTVLATASLPRAEARSHHRGPPGLAC
jgi:hypothetical protein